MDEIETIDVPADTQEATPAREPQHTEPINDRAELESKTADALAAVFKDEPDEETVEKAVSTTAEKTDEATAETEVAAPTAPTKSPTLPAAYVRSLKAMEWTDEEIADAAKRPELLPTIAKIHNTRNKEIQAWAEMGRKTRQDQTPATTEKKPVVSAKQGDYEKIDAEALKKKYGEDELIDALVGPLNAKLEAVHKLLPLIEQVQQNSQRAELETLGTQIETFFGGKELEPFKDVYGSVKKGLNEKNLDARNKVLEYADALVAGARQQGRTLSLGEALAFAHDSVSSGFKEQTVRTAIKTQMKQRERGISLKPGTKSVITSDKVSTRKDLERKVSDGLAATFGRS